MSEMEAGKAKAARDNMSVRARLEAAKKQLRLARERAREDLDGKTIEDVTPDEFNLLSAISDAQAGTDAALDILGEVDDAE